MPQINDATEYPAATPVAADYVVGVDISDTTDGASGSTRTFTAGTIAEVGRSDAINTALASLLSGGTVGTALATPSLTTTARSINAKFGDIPSIRDFGCVGNDDGADTTGFAAALLAAYEAHLPLFIPAAPETGGGNRGYYDLQTAMPLYDGTTLIGMGKWRSELRWTNDTNGFNLADAAGLAFTTNIHLEGLHLRGNADVSLVDTKTIGLNLQYINHSMFRDLWLQDWVDAIVIDAGNVGAVMTVFDNVDISATKYPNSVNDYPRRGLYLKGGTDKPQGIRWLDSCRIYAEESTAEETYNGDGAETDFDISLQSPLYKTTGIQVYLKNASSNEFEAQEEGTDFDLYDISSGEVEIATGAEYVDTDEVRVRFAVAPTTATGNVIVRWADPTGVVGAWIEKGSGNYIGGLVGGWDINVHVEDQQNVVNLLYGQIARNCIQLGADADNCVAHIRERTDATIYNLLISKNSGATGADYLLGGGRQYTEGVVTANQTATGTTPDDITWGSADYVVIDCDNPGPREIEVELDFGVTNTGATASAVITLEFSHDNGATWTVMRSRTVSTTATGVSGVGIRTTVFMRDYDSVSLPALAGNLRQPRYKCTVVGSGANDTWTVYAASTNASRLGVRLVNPV